MEKKMTTPTDLLCHGFPNEFGIFLNYTCTCCFNDKPDYSYPHKLFHNLFVQEGYQYDYIFDWSIQTNVPDDNRGGQSQKVNVERRKVYRRKMTTVLVTECTYTLVVTFQLWLTDFVQASVSYSSSPTGWCSWSHWPVQERRW
jgi:hypothetical protein